MHFGLYAFDLFEFIYDEAWELEEQLGTEALSCPPGMKSLHDTYTDKDSFLKDVPRLIIEHNLHGVDIDPRAAQIAGLSLWLRAQRTWQQQGLRPQNRPRIRRSNIVCAEPMPGDEAFLDEFIVTHLSTTPEGKLLSQLVRRVFDAMKLAGEAGSLLKIEEEIAGAVTEAKQAWLAGPKMEQGRLFADDTSRSEQLELRLDVRGITDETFWEKAEERIYAALWVHAEQAENGDYQRRLFAGDAAHGFAFIDLCRKRYDVALMNPPFGLATRQIFERFKDLSPSTYTEIFASFVSRGLNLLGEGGLVGAITSRAFLTIKRLQEWRQHEVLPSLELLLDLGGQVMDSALVESCAYALRRGTAPSTVYALDAKKVHEHYDRETVNLLTSPSTEHFVVARRDLEMLPGGKFLYSLPPEIHALLLNGPPFEPDVGTVREGMRTFDDFRFVRLRYEVPTDKVGRGQVWEPLAKGGAFAKYYSDIHLMLNWESDGKELREINIQHNGQVSQVRQASELLAHAGMYLL